VKGRWRRAAGILTRASALALLLVPWLTGAASAQLGSSTDIIAGVVLGPG
jgi:hypothetical protein